MYYTLLFGITFSCYVSAELSRTQDENPEMLSRDGLSMLLLLRLIQLFAVDTKCEPSVNGVSVKRQGSGSSKFSHSSRGNGITKSSRNVVIPDNDTYLDKPDNMMRMPAHMEEYQVKKKITKKHPKSTIQKIIAKNRKNKKVMYRRLTSKPTPAPISDDVIDDFVPEKDDDPTTHPSIKKKIKKWNNKLPKYHSQVQRMQARPLSKHRRTKRNTERENTRILEDLDELEVIDNKKDYDVVKMHYKNYW